jgi:NTE family protein
VGTLSTSSEEIKIGSWAATFTYDQLDSINFPREGLMANISWSASREELGSNDEYDRTNINGLWANTWDKNTVMVWGGIAGVTNTDDPGASGFSIGGLFYLELS